MCAGCCVCLFPLLYPCRAGLTSALLTSWPLQTNEKFCLRTTSRPCVQHCPASLPSAGLSLQLCILPNSLSTTFGLSGPAFPTQSPKEQQILFQITMTRAPNMPFHVSHGKEAAVRLKKGVVFFFFFKSQSAWI